MARIDDLRQLTNEEAENLYKTLNSKRKVLEQLKLAHDPRAYKILNEKLQNVPHTRLRTKETIVEQILVLAPTANSITDLVLKLGLQPVGGNFDRISSFLRELDIDLKRKPKVKWLETSVYCVDSIFPRRALSNRVKRDNWLSYVCEKCLNRGDWLNEPLNLQIDHKNGISIDHRKENLRFLCPNCHSQTETYGGKNNKQKLAPHLGAAPSNL